ncbi:helix-turn-helix transcriptional regulator [Flavobacterium sp. N502540]|uniref:helix-turn-helix transcriptional regulator n=1 Tax=Flavobacterium sp. N502540 TaxID=2986838 RepID=UPI002224F010|nr:helix-turn-helix transcriptional regulator [Flavobacterium sp. N502540]
MNVIVGNKLKILRKNKRMSQEEVADFLHISQSAYARMESGESSSWANHILRICEIFEIIPEDLLKVEHKKQDLNGEGASTTTAHLSGKIIEEYEERIKELKQTIRDLKKV